MTKTETKQCWIWIVHHLD